MECIKLDIILGLVLKLLVCAYVSFGVLSGRKGRKRGERKAICFGMNQLVAMFMFSSPLVHTG